MLELYVLEFTSGVSIIPIIDSDENAVTNESLIVPPNTRASSPLPSQDAEGRTEGRLPYAEPIPPEYVATADPWIEVGPSGILDIGDFTHDFQEQLPKAFQMEYFGSGLFQMTRN